MTYRLILFISLFCSCLLRAQDIPHVEVTRLWATGLDTIIELENEGFESGLGDFYNSGSVNWTTTDTIAVQDTTSATSNLIVGGQTAILGVDITVPDLRTAIVKFFIRMDISLGPDMDNEVVVDFLVDGTPVSSDLITTDTAWAEKKHYVTQGSHTLNWAVQHADPTSDDEVYVFLDSVVICYHDRPALRIADGSEGFGKVLTSDLYGNAKWMHLSELDQYDNADYYPLVPLTLDARHEDNVALLVSNGNISGLRSSSNTMFGFSAMDNPVGYFVKNTGAPGAAGTVGYHAVNNGIGFYADNSETGFTAESSGYGFLCHLMDSTGFVAEDGDNTGFLAYDNNYDGFYANGNHGEGFYAYLNGGHGFLSENNGGHGFQSSNNGHNGFSAEYNVQDGFYAIDHQWGFWAEDNTNGAYMSIRNSGYGFQSNASEYRGYEATGSLGYGFLSVGDTSDAFYSVGNANEAGYFTGTVEVTGNISKGAGSFKIDHPLDPENKFLYHSFVESPDMLNVYNGNVVLDQHGEATVELADWFDTLNQSSQYQLTCIGAFAPVYIAERIQGNRFKIAGGTPGMKVSWQVTGIRKDPYANQNRIQVEVEKPAKYRGYYLHPEAYTLGFEQGVEYVRLGHKTLEQLVTETGSKMRTARGTRLQGDPDNGE